MFRKTSCANSGTSKRAASHHAASTVASQSPPPKKGKRSKGDDAPSSGKPKQRGKHNGGDQEAIIEFDPNMRQGLFLTLKRRFKAVVVTKADTFKAMRPCAYINVFKQIGKMTNT